MPKIAEIEYTPNPNAVKFQLKEPVALGFPKSFPSKEIAEELGSALRTVETHRQNMSAKLELSGSHSLLKFAYENRSFL